MNARIAPRLAFVLLAAWLAPAAPAAELASPPTWTVYVPTSASIHGNAGAFFHTDLWVVNRSYTSTLSVTVRYYCFAGPCASASTTVLLAPRESKLYPDVAGVLLASPGTAGSIVLTYQNATEDLVVSTRTYTPSLPGPTNGTAIPGLRVADAKLRALFPGLGTNGGDLSSGFRSNAGVFNPWNYPVHVTFTIASPSGAVLGTATTDVPATSAAQINDVFGAAGIGSTVTANATLTVTATNPVFHFVTVIDNQSGDSIFVPASDDAPAAPVTSLVSNGSFDSTVSGWTPVGLALAWSPTDSRGIPGSGSAMVTNTAATAYFGGDWLAQCVAVSPGAILTVSGRTYISSAQANTGIAQVEVYFYGSPGCTGASAGSLASQAGEDAWRADRWNLNQTTGPIPAGAASASIEVQVTKNEAGGSLVAYIDDVFVVTSAR